jgi:dipeptidyl aminopeptidase/acylaminoacyl peptidase
VKSSEPWIDAKRMQPMTVMKFKTRDGRTLDSYVTLPAGATKENPPPLLVLSHGGPWARDRWGFNGEVQFFASRGYAVLQTNYRGSTGYDWMFPEEDRYAFRKMHDDVTDATNTLIKSGLVDAKRVGIMGGSFGAYLALSGVAHEPDLYRCAVVNAGVFDWEAIVQEEKYFQYYDNNYAYLVRKLGDPKKEKEKFTAISPGRHVANIHVPVFVAHGTDDPVAPITESKRLVSELEHYHIPHETYFKNGEGHGMAHLQNQVELYTRIEAFLAKNLMAKTAP